MLEKRWNRSMEAGKATTSIASNRRLSAPIAQVPCVAMSLELILKGLLIGLILGLPTGPVGILCLQRTVASGRRAGLASGVGACLADFVYVVVVQIGVGRYGQFIDRQSFYLHMLGALIIVGVGSAIVARSSEFRPTLRDRYKGQLLSAFMLSVTNPTMLISLTALFTTLRFRPDPVNALTTSVTGASVFAGSLMWWSAVTYWLDRSSAGLSDQGVRRASTVAGVALILLGVVSLSSLLV